MIRDLSRLANLDHDVLIVGGGIHGLAVAYDAAQRGLAVALVERADFGGATSFNHLKTIHGGLRYLQRVDLARMREAVRERRAFARIAPNFVAPLAFVMPTQGLARGRLAMRVALWADALVAGDRNVGLAATHHLPAGRIVSRDECLRLADGASPSGLTGGALWHDYQTTQGDRLTLAFALAAANHGAVLANYVEATGPLRQGSRLSGIRGRDVLTGAPFDVRARVIVNAAGPWAAGFLAQCGVRRQWPLLKAMNLVTTRPAQPAALVAATRRGRALVLMPWQGRSLVGTFQSPYACPASDQAVTAAELAAFLSEVNDTYPGLRLEASDVSLVHRGIVPAILRRGRATLLGQSRVLDHRADGVSEIVSLIGVKYTTARAVAERTVDLLLNKLGRAPVRCRSAEELLPGGDIVTGTEVLTQSSTWLDADVARRLLALYGGDARQVVEVGATNPSLQSWVATNQSAIGAEIVYAVHEEMAQTLTDVIVRRTALGAGGFPGMAVVQACATLVAEALGWPQGRIQREIADLKRFYEPVRVGQ